MKFLILIIFSLIFISCNDTKQDTKSIRIKEFETKEIDNKLDTNGTKLNIEKLVNESKNGFVDLSYKSLTEFPDLSSYEIISLNISNNKISEIPESRLPKNLKSLIGKNNIITDFILSYDYKNDISLIDLSNNKLDTFYVKIHPKKIILNNNNLVYVDFYQKNINYLDISNNKSLSNVVDFVPRTIDTIIRNDIFSENPLVERFVGESKLTIE